jgi:hypothetical protein
MEQSQPSEADRRSSGRCIPYSDRLVLPGEHLFMNLRSNRLRLILLTNLGKKNMFLKMIL